MLTFFFLVIILWDMSSNKLEIRQHDIHKHRRLQKRAGADLRLINNSSAEDHNLQRAANRDNNDALITWINSDEYAIRHMRVPYIAQEGVEVSALIIPDIEDLAVSSEFVGGDGSADFVGMLLDPTFTYIGQRYRLLEAVVWQRVMDNKDSETSLDDKFASEVTSLSREMRKRLDMMPAQTHSEVVNLIWSFAAGYSALVGMSKSKIGNKAKASATINAADVFNKKYNYSDEDGSPLGYNEKVTQMITDNILLNKGTPDASVLSSAINIFAPSRVRVL